VFERFDVVEIEATGGTASGIAVDVCDHKTVEVIVASVVQEWGRVDVLVANAGGGSWSIHGHQGSRLDPALYSLSC
jgi:NADP-dependent 3-hydroxy acid dehydrogenase YdfG